MIDACKTVLTTSSLRKACTLHTYYVRFTAEQNVQKGSTFRRLCPTRACVTSQTVPPMVPPDAQSTEIRPTIVS